MRFKQNTKLEYGLAPINIVPLIHCVFIVPVFFMLASSVIFPPRINVKLPKTVTSDVLNDQNLIITITSENIVYWNNKIVTISELATELKSIQPNKSVLIKSDRRAYVGRIVDVWDLCRKFGIEKVNIATTGKQ